MVDQRAESESMTATINPTSAQPTVQRRLTKFP